jgi:hypothetical protein
MIVEDKGLSNTRFRSGFLRTKDGGDYTGRFKLVDYNGKVSVFRPVDDPSYNPNGVVELLYVKEFTPDNVDLFEIGQEVTKFGCGPIFYVRGFTSDYETIFLEDRENGLAHMTRTNNVRALPNKITVEIDRKDAENILSKGDNFSSSLFNLDNILKDALKGC